MPTLSGFGGTVCAAPGEKGTAWGKVGFAVPANGCLATLVLRWPQKRWPGGLQHSQSQLRLQSRSAGRLKIARLAGRPDAHARRGAQVPGKNPKRKIPCCRRHARREAERISATIAVTDNFQPGRP